MSGEGVVDGGGPQRQPAGEVLGAQRCGRMQVGVDLKCVAPVKPRRGTARSSRSHTSPAGARRGPCGPRGGRSGEQGAGERSGVEAADQDLDVLAPGEVARRPCHPGRWSGHGRTDLARTPPGDGQREHLNALRARGRRGAAGTGARSGWPGPARPDGSAGDVA